MLSVCFANLSALDAAALFAWDAGFVTTRPLRSSQAFGRTLRAALS